MTHRRPLRVHALLCAAAMLVLTALPVAGQEATEPSPVDATAEATMEPLRVPRRLDQWGSE